MRSRGISTVSVIVPPEPLLALQDVKDHLRVETNDSDWLIQNQIAAATASLDGPTGTLGRCLGPQTLELAVPHDCASRIELPYPPIISIVEIAYDDAVGVEQLIDPATYVYRSGGLWFSGGAPSFEGGIRIRYRAGYINSDAEVVPYNLKAALLLIVGDLWANREAQQIATGTLTQINNPTVERLIAPFRIYAIA